MKRIIIILTLFSILLLAGMILSAHTSYAPMSATEMQNIYIQNILFYSIPVIIINIFILIVLVTQKKERITNKSTE